MHQKFIRDRITDLRMRKNISERQLSLSLGKNPGYINNVVSGKTLPTMDSFIEICDFFEITPFDFFNENLEDSLKNKEIIKLLKKLSGDNLDKVIIILSAMEPKLFNDFNNFLFEYTRLMKNNSN